MENLKEEEIKLLLETTDEQLLEKFPKSKYGFNRGQLRTLKRDLQEEQRKNADYILEQTKERNERNKDKSVNVELIKRIEVLEKEREAMLALSKQSFSNTIRPLSESRGEATAFVIASDWHIEERVSPQSVNGLNEYSLDIAKKRSQEFFQIALKLRDLENKTTNVPRMVLALLGDFITGNIHEENLAVCSLDPVDAAIEAKNYLKSGIDFLLKESNLKEIIIPCHAGNHSRITKLPRSSETEMGNSLELFTYAFLAQEYANNPRVKFLISRSYTSRLQIYDTVLRLHHGHKIKFQGGIGGISVPTTKYILRANTAWEADYDVFGHHHQKQKGPRFICNGSMIGYNAYAQDNGFEYEEPSQTYFLINKRWKDIIDYRPILFSK